MHDSTESTEDSFTLSASAYEIDRRSVPVTISVTVIPVNDEPPKVTRNTGLEVLFCLFKRHSLLAFQLSSSMRRWNISIKYMLHSCSSVTYYTMIHLCYLYIVNIQSKNVFLSYKLSLANINRHLLTFFFHFLRQFSLSSLQVVRTSCSKM